MDLSVYIPPRPGEKKGQMRFLTYATDVLKSVRKRGALSTVRLLVPEVLFDWKYGTATFKLISLEELGDVESGNRPHGGPYQGANAYLFGLCMDAIRASAPAAFSRDHSHHGFVDYGCGKGRALLLAASHGFRSAVGVEFSPTLADTARSNVEVFRSKHFRGTQTTAFSVATADATEFAVPADADTFFFFNPFGPAVLAPVLSRIAESLAASPRPAVLIYLNPVHADLVSQTKPWREFARVSTDSRHADAILYSNG